MDEKYIATVMYFQETFRQKRSDIRKCTVNYLLHFNNLLLMLCVCDVLTEREYQSKCQVRRANNTTYYPVVMEKQ